MDSISCVWPRRSASSPRPRATRSARPTRPSPISAPAGLKAPPFSGPEQQLPSETLMPDPLSPDLLRKMHAYWRAANYLSVGQIYLQDNPLLESPLRLEHIKPRLLGHWGTTPGLNFLYVHLNRLIKENDLNMMYIIGPGHGGPGLVAQTYLEGSYTEHYPAIERSRNGLQRLFRQFSWPYGIPSHVSPETESLERPRWPMIIFRTPKGWTGPKFVDGKPVEGTWRAHQVPIADFAVRHRLAAACLVARVLARRSISGSWV